MFNEIKKVKPNKPLYLFLTAGAEGEQSHGAVGCTAIWPRWHTMVGGLAGALVARFTTQSGGQILPDLLPLSLLEVVLGWILQMGLHLHTQARCEFF